MNEKKIEYLLKYLDVLLNGKEECSRRNSEVYLITAAIKNEIGLSESGKSKPSIVEFCESLQNAIENISGNALKDDRSLMVIKQKVDSVTVDKMVDGSTKTITKFV